MYSCAYGCNECPTAYLSAVHGSLSDEHVEMSLAILIPAELSKRVEHRLTNSAFGCAVTDPSHGLLKSRSRASVLVIALMG